MLNLTIVVPCYNEQDVLPEASHRLLQVLDSLALQNIAGAGSSILFVDDGSADQTWALIEGFCSGDERVEGLKLSRNRGHQNALLAGLFAATGDAVISIDADLQDDLGAIAEMLKEHLSGADIVYGVRADRTSDTFFKRSTAQMFYRTLSFLGVQTIYNHADYRLMSRRAIEALRGFGETNLYLRGIVPLIGFKSVSVTYTRQARFAGETKYSLRKMLSLSANAITSFSVAPLRFISAFGLIVSAGSVIVSLWVLGVALFTDRAVAGWASTVLPIYFLGGIQMLSIGVIGEYVGRVYMEIKRRPRYFVESHVAASAPRSAELAERSEPNEL